MRAFLPALALLGACAAAPPAVGPVEREPPAAPPDPRDAPAARGGGCGMDLRRLLSDELGRRPLAQDEDLYKIVHQAVLGPEEGAPDPVRARAVLARELDRAGAPIAGEPFVEDLDETEGTVRLSLRRWKFVRGTVDELWPVILQSTRAMAADPDRLARCLDEAGPVLTALGRDAASFRATVGRLAAQGYPPVPHGAAYLEAYRPAYRVVLRRFLPPWVNAPPPSTG